MSYWSTAAAIETYTFNPEPHTDAKGTQWVSSTASTTVTFTVRNPKNFELKNPADADAPTDSITFPYDPAISGATAPQANRDYTFKKISNTEFELTYTPTFLQRYEWRSVDITPTIVLHTADGRMFKQTIPFTLKVNTPPPAIAKCVIARTKTASAAEPAYYVLCLQLPAAEMNRELNGSLLHKDITGITINETPYSLSVNSAQKQFNVKAGSPFIGKDSVEKLAADAEEVPSGWTLYFKTDVEVGGAKNSYTISIKDEKGLYSKPVTAATQLSEPQPAQIDVIKGTKIASLSGDGTVPAQAIVIKADATTPEAQIKLSVPATGGVSATGVTIHYTLTEVGRTPAPEQTETSPITVDMPLNGSGEKMYALTYSTDGVGFKPSASKTVYYKVVKEHTVTFDSKGGSAVPAQKILHGSKISPIPSVSTARSGYAFRNWCIDEACTTAWDFASGMVTSDITLYAKWDPAGGVSYTVQHYQQNIDDDNYTIVSGDTQTWNGTTGQLTTATANGYAGFEPLPIEQKTIDGDGTTVVEVKYKRKRITVTFQLAGGKIDSSTDDVTRKGKFNATFTVPVPTRDGYTFTGWAPALSASPTFPAADMTYTAQWTPKTYTVTFKVDGGHGALTGTHSGTPKTANGSTEQQFESVPHNSTINFTATPAEGWEVDSWTGVTPDTSSPDKTKATLSSVTNTTTVTVKFKKKQAGPISDWEALRTAVKKASDGDVIEIEQNLTYNKSHSAGKDSIIEVNNNITIKSKGSDTCTLNAGGKGADSEQSNDKSTGVFEVSGGKTLTLENLILTKTEKYAVYVAEGDNSLIMKKVTITNCKTRYNAAGIYFNKGKNLTLTDCTIENCKGKGSNSSGGIDIQAPKEAVTITDTTIQDCEATVNGGGINLNNTQNILCTLKNVTVHKCSALRGGGIHAKAGTLTISGGSFTENSATGKIANGGGGAIYSEGAEITITECTIGGDDINNGNYAVRGGGIFVNHNAICTLKADTKISGNTAMQIGADVANGGGIFVDKVESGTQAGKLTIKGIQGKPVVITKNEAQYSGGGLYSYGPVTIEYAEIKENTVIHDGGGMYNAGICTMNYVTIQDNTASDSTSGAGRGGGIYNEKTLTLTNTTVTDNAAKLSGGALHLESNETFKMSGSTVITVDSSKNDIYLTNDAFITLTDQLTTSEEKFARITLNSSGGYQEHRVVVKGDFSIPTNYVDKFMITNNLLDAQKWELSLHDNELKLKKK